MSAYVSGVANSIVASKTIVASAQDVTDGSVSVDFNIDETLTPFVQWTDSAGTLKAVTGANLTVANGVVTFTAVLVADDEVRIMVVRDKV